LKYNPKHQAPAHEFREALEESQLIA